MDKIRKKEILNQLTQKNLEAFKKGLPINENLFLRLFYFLDFELAKNDCNHKTTLTVSFLEKNGVKDIAPAIGWLAGQGGFCDCEILANVESQFDYLTPKTINQISKDKVTKQKLNGVKTDFGFSIEKIPSPWSLTEKIVNTIPVYSFQIGKSNDCVITLETSFPSAQFNNDRHWLDLWIKETNLHNNLNGLIVERPDLEHYYCIVVKTQDWTPVFYWFKSKLTDKWLLKMKTGISRHKGDFKEAVRLLNNINVDK